MKNYKIFTKVNEHKTNEISQNFIYECSVSMYFINFLFSFGAFESWTQNLNFRTWQCYLVSLVVLEWTMLKQEIWYTNNTISRFM